MDERVSTGQHRVATSQRSLHEVARLLHERVINASYDSLMTALIHLHQPYLVSDVYWPVCQGCDRDDREAGDAVWPCRSYTTIASNLLQVRDIETYMAQMRVELEHRNRTGGERLLP